MDDAAYNAEPARCVRLCVAGLTLCVSSPHPTDALRLGPGFEPFLVRSVRGPSIRLQLLSDTPPLPEAPPLFEARDAWSVHRAPAGLLYRFESAALRPRPYKALLVDEAITHGTIFLPPSQDGARRISAMDFPLDELLFQHRLTRDGALEVHAACVVHEGSALLVCGRSGAGKSTFVRLWRRRYPADPVLSDDRIVVEPRRREVVAHGTPWHGEDGLAAPTSERLAGIFFLNQSSRDLAHRLSPQTAAARLLARSFFPIWDAHASDRALAAAAQAVTAVPCFELELRRGPSAVDVALAALRAPAREPAGQSPRPRGRER